MDTTTAISLLGNIAHQEQPQTWGDIGAGTGVFTVALQEVLASGSVVWAVDKNPHVLWNLPAQNGVNIRVEEGNFERNMELTTFDGIVMANALHYAADPVPALQNVLQHLKPGGTFILIEYDSDRANPPWVPYPISWARFQALAPQVGLQAPEKIHQVSSRYGYDYIYSAMALRSAD
ncbi:MAG TPA: hypothetical protein DCS93_31885 [Microscillaceae bacterium]|nr:hypothetical protein [Microscillaceae bacterium]